MTRATCHRRRGPAHALLATVAGVLLATGCATAPTKTDSPAATPAAPPSQPTLPAPTPQAPSGPGAVNVPVKPGPTVRPGTVKGKGPIVSEVLDKYCAQVVAPFDIDVNLSTLAKITAEGVPELFKDRQPNTHFLSKAVREEAVRMNWLPMRAEKRYGAYLHEQLAKKGDLIDRDSRLGQRLYPVADEMLRRVLQGVGQPHAYEFTLYVRGSREENATALPGGIIYIDAPLLEPDKKAMGYFALGHEVAHVLQRHETRIVQARIIDTISLTGSAKDLIGTISDPADLGGKLLATVAVGKNLFQKHFASQELQSDACAVRVLDASFDNDMALLDASLNAFILSLPKDPGPNPKKPAGPTSAPSTAQSNADLEKLTNLLEDVAKPADRHPTTTERRDNLIAVRKTVVSLRQAAPTAPTVRPPARPPIAAPVPANAASRPVRR